MSYYLIDPEQRAKARGDQPAAIPSLGNAQPAQPAQPQPMPATPGNEWQSLKDKWGMDRNEVVQQINNAPPEQTALLNQGLAAPAMATSTAPAKTLTDFAPAAPSRLQAGQLVDNLPARVNSPYTVTREDPQSLGMQQHSGQTTDANGVISGYNNGASEEFKTRYNVTGPGNATGFAEFTGNRPVGGGTVSAPDQGNGGTVEGNVAALNRQTAALTSLREAQNPGITTGTGAFAPRQETAAPVNPFALPGDRYGDDKLRQAKYEGMLSDAATGRGYTKAQRAAMINSAQGLLAPGLEAMKLQGEQAKSLNDLAQRQQMTPYQQASLGIEQQKANALQNQQQNAQLQKQQTNQVKNLEDLRQGLYGSKEFQEYSMSRPMMQTAEDLAKQDTAAAGNALAVITAKLRDPTSVARESEVANVKQGSGNLLQKAGGWVKEKVFGESGFTEGATKNLLDANRAQIGNYELNGMKKIDSMAAEAAKRGVPLQDILDPGDYERYPAYKAKQQPQAQGTGASYRWDGQKLVPAQ